ncbi:MAG: hypothetical protein KF813_03600 [Trueperaceae bacterium]|nr:hypothetical protein [Trueperaceae bacterium]
MVEVRLALRSIVSALVVLVLLTACGGTGPTPPGSGLQEVSGQVSLPPGAGIDTASLTVLGAHGTFPVAANGSFTALLPAGVTAEMAVVDATGALLLLALRDGATVVADAGTTARGLLFYLLGGFMLPSDQHATLRTLIGEEAGLTQLTDHLESALAAGGRPLSSESGALEAALEQAWASVLGEFGRTGASATPEAQQTGGSNNIVIQPGAGVLQAGSEVIHNPLGAGVAVQNHIRRPAALLAYQVGYEDADGNTFDIDPPRRTGTVDVPSTGRLDFIEALKDVLTGRAPWTPELSQGLQLSLHDDTHKTFYELVLLGPSLDVVTRPPLYDDPRFSSQRSAWNEIIADKLLEQFFDDIAMPLLESLMFGGVVAFDVAELRAFRAEFRAATDSRLAGLGIYLRDGGTYANAVKMFLENLGQNTFYRTDLFEAMKRTLPEAELNKLHFESMDANLKARASSSAVALAVQLSLAAGDLAALIKDLHDALPAVSWSATAAPTLFYLTPERAIFTKWQPQIELRVDTRGPVEGNFLFRWTTTGAHGRVTDGPNTGLSIVTPHRNVWYTHNTPLHILDEQRDTVTVEVFQVAPGATSIPAGAEPSARMTALLEGFHRDIHPQLEVQYGMTPEGYLEFSVKCATMYVRIPKEAGVRGYAIRFTDWGGINHPYNTNYFLYRWGNWGTGFRVDDPDIRPYEGACAWRQPNGEWASPPDDFQVYDAGADYLVHVMHARDLHQYERPPRHYLEMPEWVRLWYDWASQGTLTIELIR